ncbi:MAG: polysaccharide deacetylase family protein [Desulfobacterales bacterium]|nr:polysaccharide deacetylase family protein [Desulfobacterales bacterium]
MKPKIFQSDEYIIYQLQDKETPDLLAKKFLKDETKSWIIQEANQNVLFKKGEMIVIPLIESNKGGLWPNGYQEIPILCYHHFASECNSALCMPSHIFEQQMKYLHENGYKTVKFQELFEFMQFRRALPKKSVAITIDDGYRSTYHIAYPILKKYGFKATLFIYTDFVGVSQNAITWNQLRELKADGFEIGSHTISHSDLTRQMNGESTQAYISRIEMELGRSKQIIDKKLNQNTIFLAFPYGRYNEKVLKICERLGYKLATSVERGSNPFFADPLILKRNQILKRDLKTFISRLKTFHRLSLER